MTVLFAQLTSIVELGEQLDAEPLRFIVASAEEAMAREVERYDGTLGKFGTDQVMALFGAPLGHDDDPERAIRAALGIQVAVADLDQQLAASHGVRIGRVGIGIDTGEVVAGGLGGSAQSVYTVVGDAVNVARGLASAAEPGEILVGTLTRRLSEPSFEAEVVRPLSLHDRAAQVQAFRIVRQRVTRAVQESTVLVGREGELDYLRAALDHARGGRGLSIVVRGEAGVGKSRLLREFQTRVDATVTQITARCASFETDTPYALVAGLLRAAFQIEAGADEATVRQALLRGLANLDHEAPEPQLQLLLNVLGYGDQFPFNPESRRPILLMVLRLILARATASGALVVAVEDLHWADAASVTVVSDLATELTARTCLFVGTARPEWDPPWAAEKLELYPLQDGDARRLIGQLLHAAPDDALASAILRRTGGNPFFVEEVVHDLATANLDSHVPASVQEVIQARLDRLPADIKDVLHTSAVCGTTFAYHLLEQLVPSRALGESLEVLERERFITPITESGERLFAFRHALIQDVAYRVQLKSQLRRTHRAVGRSIEHLYANRLDEFVGELAFHFARSDDDAQALYWLVRAGDRARALYANAEALRLYAAALERAADGQGSVDASAILERVSDVHIFTGSYDDAIGSLQAALARTPASEGSMAGRLWRRMGTALAHKGAYSEALSAFDRAITAVGDSGDPEAARIQVQVGYLHVRRGDHAEARTALAKAVDIGARVSADDVVAEALKQLGNIAAITGDLRAASDLYMRSRVQFERLEDTLGLADTHHNLAILYRRAGRWEDALGEYEATLALRRRMGHLLGIGQALNNIAEVHRTRGDPELALTFYDRAIETLEAIGHNLEVALVLVGRGAARIEVGDVEHGRSDLLNAQTRFAAIGSTLYMPDLYRYLALAELAAGDLMAAELAAERSLEYAQAAEARDQQAITQRLLGQLAHARGEHDTAYELLEASRRTLATIGYAAELARTEAELRTLAHDPEGRWTDRRSTRATQRAD